MKRTREHTQYLNEVVAASFTSLSLSLSHTHTHTHTQFSLFSSYFKNPTYHQNKATKPNHWDQITETEVSILNWKKFADSWNWTLILSVHRRDCYPNCHVESTNNEGKNYYLCERERESVCSCRCCAAAAWICCVRSIECAAAAVGKREKKEERKLVHSF